MSGTVSFDWIDNGAKIEVKRIPINGERELKQILLRHSKFVTMQRNSFAHAFHGIVLAAKVVLDKKGVNDAKEAWDASLNANGIMRKELEWDYEEWQDRFLAYYEDHTLRQLGAANFDEAKVELEKRMIALGEELQTMGDEPGEFEATYSLTELYWRLRAARAQAITPPDGEPVRLDWSREGRPAIMDLLGDFADGDVLGKFRKAERAQKGAFDIKDYQEVSEDEMRGKSTTESTPSTKSSGDSPASSEPTTAEASEQVTSEAPSG